ncbi:Ig-like domain repeat protein [Diaphorobacter ruginosibacter]|uniref:Ig-like domain repeat protein n=1 Tax=Diaphorobacter ruginosibacter TaxID=1715720 RepID=A0A7G9RKV8_9BURK|nr:endonuclease/exonuclease/phosphatase family protein [Diaphorobacter ruginosibacter]QNN56233.1 Ig-like domain repeat protein [Diaphorobacter ruginosibacter]
MFELSEKKRNHARKRREVGDGQGWIGRACLLLALMLCSWLWAQRAHAAGEVQWQLDRQVYAASAPIKVRFQNLAAPSAKHWVGIWAYPDSGARAGAWDRASNGGKGSLKWAYLPAAASGEVTLQGLAPGRYSAFLLANDGYDWLSTPIIFQVTADGVAVKEKGLLASNQRVFDEGSTVSLAYDGITASARNWIGVWKYEDGPGAKADGPWSFAQSNASDPWKYVTAASGTWDVANLPAGTYAAFLLANDGYEWLAPPAVFEVKAKPIDPSTLIGPPAFDGRSTELKVLQFNVWLRATGVGAGGADMVADVIRDTGADVITLSETGAAYGLRLVNDLAQRGYRFHSYGPDKDVGVVSRYPILETGEFNRFSKAVIDVNGTPVAVYSGHLEYQWYVCYLPRGYGGGTPGGNPTSEYGWNKIASGPITDVPLILDLNEKSGRPESIRQFVADAKKERDKGRLVLMAGDFNEPSHLDWSAATRDLYDHHGAIVPWQSTTLLEQAGYLDAYRVRFPDPVTHPGFTWPSDNPAVPTSRLTWAPEADERDRIDYVFFQPDARLQLQGATVVGPRKSIVKNQRVEEAGGDPFIEPLTGWPTDHKSVMATFVIKPLALTLPELSRGKQNEAYRGALTVLGGAAPFTYRISKGDLPPGMTLAGDGTLGGTPTASGLFAFTVQVEDARGSVAERDYSVEIAAAEQPVKIRSKVQLTSSSNPAKPGDQLRFTVSVVMEPVAEGSAKAAALPTGHVEFTDNGVLAATVPLQDGQAGWAPGALQPGKHAIVASYSGDVQFAAASMSMTQEVSAVVASNPAPVPGLNDFGLWLVGLALAVLGGRRLRRH